MYDILRHTEIAINLEEEQKVAMVLVCGETLAECSVRSQYPTYYSRNVSYLCQTLRSIRYYLDTGICRLFGKLGTTSMPVPGTSARKLYLISGVVTLRKWFGTASIPYRTNRYASARTQNRYPTLSVSSAGLQYHYPKRWRVRYDLNTGARHFCKFGTPT